MKDDLAGAALVFFGLVALAELTRGRRAIVVVDQGEKEIGGHDASAELVRPQLSAPEEQGP